jgi:SAM-dependent methyltransferase
MLQSKGLRHGHVLDLGCGSGHSTAVFAKGGYDVVGMDRSPVMIRLAKHRVPRGTFMIGSRLTATKVGWDAIVAIGEVVNYVLSRLALPNMIRRTLTTLRPGGYLVFDVRTPPPSGSPWEWASARTGKDWAVIASSCVASTKQQLTRTITTFRKIHGKWRRGRETHRQQLYHPIEIHRWLQAEGVRAQVHHGYGGVQLTPSGRVLIARKPLGESQ